MVLISEQPQPLARAPEYTSAAPALPAISDRPAASDTTTAFRRKARSVVSASMLKIIEKDVVVELRGFPTPAQFEVGGKAGNVVTQSSIPTRVHRGWRIIAVDGSRTAGAELAGALRSAQRRPRYSLTFRMGEKEEGADAEEEAERRRRAEAADAAARQKAADDEAARKAAAAEAAARRACSRPRSSLTRTSPALSVSSFHCCS